MSCPSHLPQHDLDTGGGYHEDPMTRRLQGPGQNHLSAPVSLWPHFYEELDFLSSVCL